ncbi:hypothetical protein [Oceanobacter sp. 4_MG-2023]|uniref:hypothetical protein n=1 Tax=Oceanobacter sp. 4_MG-2023 TaxID=3062623 RepID=UPI002733721E|nr:hypothetical protein [Oceanobacter sp. 4_MG-2023]MDP2549489.1 hypothetical protein [Oceanobacter sp. 4_MG-2023]
MLMIADVLLGNVQRPTQGINRNISLTGCINQISTNLQQADILSSPFRRASSMARLNLPKVSNGCWIVTVARGCAITRIC